MVDTESQFLTVAQREMLQRTYLWSQINGRRAEVSDDRFEPDGRRRAKTIREAISAGFLRPLEKDSSNGKTYEVTSQVLSTLSVEPPDLMQVWSKLYERASQRRVYSRPWVRLEDLSMGQQAAVLDCVSMDWYVVSSVPHEYHATLADEPDVVLKDVAESQAYHRFYSGPYETLTAAAAVRSGKSTCMLAVSSVQLREAVAARISEETHQRLFVSNLLWALATLNIVPKDLLFNGDGTAKLNSQLIEGHTFGFGSSAPAPAPTTRSEVNWQANLNESIERLKSQIDQLQKTLDQYRQIDHGIQTFGGWEKFMDEMEARIRQEQQ